MTTTSRDNAPSHATLITVAERMHATCATYDAALPHVEDPQLKHQLQNFCDENHQHLALLQQCIDKADVASSLAKAAGSAAAQASGWLQGLQLQLGQLLGTGELFSALHAREEALVAAYETLGQHSELQGALRTLAHDQLDCARARQRWLADPNNLARHKAPAPREGITEAGRRGVSVNNTKQASSEFSDC